MDDDLDLHLRQLVYAAQEYSAKSAERRKVLNKLIAKIQSSGKLTKFLKYRYLPDFPDIYSEAEANTYLEICKNIENYRPEHPVMAWVNKRFNSRFIDVLRRYENKQPKILSLDELDSCNSSSDKPVSRELSRVQNEIKDKLITETEDELEISTTKNFVADDPEGILQNTYIGEDTNANLQKVMLMRFSEKTWEEISQKLGHPVPRLSELYQRNIKKRKIIDYFRKYLQ
ncbi:hypothetical protein CK510_12215 [Brunnivagina elsteri CCALA 953]|uniref:Sigma-70 family RNA polymerase sigma factor n=2 Tax=Brunnivagina TaxID=3344733 RepID=A0A2A2TJF1_9CYAN|nr:hypothetical protein CK510_12215 [Calothrix elsteri CCALA 953]